MTTSAEVTFGTTLSINGTVIAEVKSFTPPKFMQNKIDVTNHQSPSHASEFKGGIISMGDVTIKGNFIKGDTNGQIALQAALLAGSVDTYVLTHPDGTTTCTFSALVTEWGLDDMPADTKEISFAITLAVTGLGVMAISASANLTTLTGIEENTGAALTFTPTFNGAVKKYNMAVNTASTWVKFTPTLAGATITINNGTTSQDVASGAQSGTIATTDAAVTTITLSVKETGKTPNVYTVNVYTP